MKNDDIVVLISIMALVVSVINMFMVWMRFIRINMESKSMYIKRTIKFQKLQTELEKEKRALYSKRDKEQIYLKKLSEIINEIYPECNATISVKLIAKSDRSNPSDSEVISLASYPDEEYNIKISYRIKDNTEFNSIIGKNKEYFFVSDLKKYSVLKPYINTNQYFMEKYNTSIVVPIQKESKEKEDIIGFLCVNSMQKMGDVKKNKKLIHIIKSIASFFYDYLVENKLNQEEIILKKE